MKNCEHAYEKVGDHWECFECGEHAPQFYHPPTPLLDDRCPPVQPQPDLSPELRRRVRLLKSRCMALASAVGQIQTVFNGLKAELDQAEAELAEFNAKAEPQPKKDRLNATQEN